MRPSIADSIASPRQVATWLVFVVKGHDLSNSKCASVLQDLRRTARLLDATNLM
jgi:hypothetical protein